jgi:hypothetical protein
VVVVNYEEVDILYFIVCSQRNDQQLHQWHDNDDRKDRLVTEDLPEFFL